MAPRHGWHKGSGARQTLGSIESAAELVTRVGRARNCQFMLFEAGLAGIAWPRKYGGQGLTIKEQIVFNEEAGEYDLPLGPFTVGLGMCGPTLLAVGTEDQRRRYLEPLLRGGEIWCQLFSEPGCGSDVAAVTTRAVPDGDEWVLDGQKTWTTGAHYARFGLLLARSDPTRPKHRGLTMFVLDLEAPGVTVRGIRQMDGRSNFNDVYLDGVRVTADNVVGEVHGGWAASLATLMSERVTIGVTRLGGDAPSAGEHVARARELGRAHDVVTRDALAGFYVDERIVALLGARITDALVADKVPGPEGSIAKLRQTAVAKRSASLGAALNGMAAQAWLATEGVSWGASVLHVPQLSIAGGTDEVQRNVIAERVLGLPKEPTSRNVEATYPSAADSSHSGASHSVTAHSGTSHSVTSH